MESFRTLRAIAAPILWANIDTDAIAPTNVPPAVDMTFTNFAVRLFGVLRYHPDGRENPDFVLNRPAFRNARILVAGRNFGCGSSRENAVWALAGFGIRCILAPSFGDIFAANALQNGLLLGQMREEDIAILGAQIEERAVAGIGVAIDVDLVERTVEGPDGASYRFEISEVRRQALLDGVSQIDLLKQSRPELQKYEENAASHTPWVLVGEPH